MKALLRCCIRCVKACLVLVPVVVVLLFFLLLIFVNKEPGDNNIERSTGPVKKQRPTPVDPLDVRLERHSLCENETFLELNSENASVMSICKIFNKHRISYFRRREEKVNPYIHNFTISGSRICDDDTDIIMLIHSLHSYTDRRHAIRNTWGGAAQSGLWPGRILPLKVKIAFIFGTHFDSKQNEVIRRESEQFQDIIQGTFGEALQQHDA